MPVPVGAWRATTSTAVAATGFQQRAALHTRLARAGLTHAGAGGGGSGGGRRRRGSMQERQHTWPWCWHLPAAWQRRTVRARRRQWDVTIVPTCQARRRVCRRRRQFHASFAYRMRRRGGGVIWPHNVKCWRDGAWRQVSGCGGLARGGTHARASWHGGRAVCRQAIKCGATARAAQHLAHTRCRVRCNAPPVAGRQVVTPHVVQQVVGGVA